MIVVKVEDGVCILQQTWKHFLVASPQYFLHKFTISGVKPRPDEVKLGIMLCSDTGVDPFMTSFPELIDIGIMGHCIHGKSGLCVKSGVQCYQNGLETNSPYTSIY